MHDGGRKQSDDGDDPTANMNPSEIPDPNGPQDKPKLGANMEKINILSIQTKESTSKSPTITTKIVDNKSKPTKLAQKRLKSWLGHTTTTTAGQRISRMAK